MNKGVVQTLFSKVFYTNILDVDCKKVISLINEDFVEVEPNNKKSSSSTISKQVLEKKKFKFLKNKIMEEFNFYNKEFLKYENKFRLATSWFTKTKPNEDCFYHCHSNCMISGVLYLQTDVNSGYIQFEDYSPTRFLVEPTEYNIYNSRSWIFEPKNGMIIFFPSECYHKILKNNSNILRYSLAFNFVPTGHIGRTDSYLHLK